MKIDVGYVAELARLELTDEEKAVFQPQLENIVKYVEKISSVDVEGVEPMMHGRPLGRSPPPAAGSIRAGRATGATSSRAAASRCSSSTR